MIDLTFADDNNDGDEIFGAAPASALSDPYPEKEGSESDEDYHNRLIKWLNKQNELNA
jgi:hypothetical protein